jgi:tape measure domain-containing protein
MEIAGLLVTADADISPAERKLQQLENRFNQTGKQAGHLGEKFDQAGKASNQAAAKLDGAGKAANQAGDKFDGAGKSALQSGDKIARTGKQVDGAKKEFSQAGHEAQAFTGKLKSLDSASQGVGSRINAMVAKITGFNRASREMGSGGGMSSFLPGLANISQIIQGIPQIGQLAGALVRPLTDAAEEGVRFNMLIESATVGFKGVTGGIKEAAAYTKELTDFAVANPIFNTEDTISAARQMAVYGFETKKSTYYLKEWGNAISAGTGSIDNEKLQGVVTAFGQMRAKGKVSAEEMTQLAERGIPAWDLLAKAIGKTTAETMKLGERGQLRAAPAIDAITSMASKDPRFAGATDAFAGTMEGRLAQLKDLRQVASGKATEGLFDNLNKTLEAGLNQGNQQLIGSMAAGINLAITPVAGLISASAKSLLGGGITSGITEGIAAGKDVVKSAIWDMAQDSILDTAKDALGIHSPSEEFRKLGIFSAQGFAEGLLEGQGVANNATQRMMGSVLAQAKSKLSLDKLVSREPDFLDKLKIGSQKRGINPDHLLNVMAVETGGTFNPAAKNPNSTASGLIQFMAKTANELGTTTAALRSMSATKQLDYVFKYFDHYFKGKDLSTQGALYSAVGTGKVGRDDEAVVMRRGDRGYAGNAPTWDRNGDGIIKQGEMALAAIAKLGAGVNFSANGGVLPVRIVGGDMGAPTAADNAYFSNKMLVRPSQREDYTSGRDPFQMPDWAKAANPIEKIKDDSVAIFGVWDKTNQILRDTGQIVVDVQAPFEELKTSGTMLGAEFLNLKPLITDIGTGVAKVTEQISTSDQAAGAWADRVIQKSNKAWKEMSDGFQSTFTSALSSTEGGVKGMLSRMGLGFADMVRQMILKAAAAKLSGYLFGDTSDDNNTGGFFGKLAGKFGGGKSKKSGQSNEAIGAVVNSTVSSVTNAAVNSQPKATAPEAITQAGVAAVGAVKGAGAANTQAIDATGKKTAFSLGSISQNLVQGLAGVANAIAIGNTGGGFWKGLLGAAASGAISGALGAVHFGGGSGESGGDGGSSAAPGHAVGGFIAGKGTATSDSILSRLSNGEFVIKASSVAALGRNNLDFINQFGKLPAFATGGFIGSDNYVPPVVNNYSTSGKSSGAPAVNHHHYNFNIHAKDAQSFHRSERQVQRQLVSAVRGSGHN